MRTAWARSANLPADCSNDRLQRRCSTWTNSSKATRHFDREVIVLCVRWYLRYKLSLRDLVEMMAGTRALPGAHDDRALDPTLCARGRGNAGTASPGKLGASWRVDETYVKIKGRWAYLYRAVDKGGNASTYLLRAKRDVAAAKAFFRLRFQASGATAA